MTVIYHAGCRCGATVSSRWKLRVDMFARKHGVNCVVRMHTAEPEQDSNARLLWLDQARQMREVGAIDLRDVPADWEVTR